MAQRRNRQSLGLWPQEQETSIGGRRKTPVNRINSNNNSKNNTSSDDEDDDIKIPQKPTPMNSKKRGRPPKSQKTTTNTSKPKPKVEPEQESDQESEEEEEEEEVENEVESEQESEDFNSEEEIEMEIDESNQFSIELDETIENFKSKSIEQKLSIEYSIEKILDKKIVKNDFNNSNSNSNNNNSSSKEQFLIKWKDLAFIHSSWVDKSQLDKTKSSRMRLKRYLLKEQEFESYNDALNDFYDDDQYGYLEHYEVDRILDERVITHNSNTTTEYLVKWKSLSYELSTWEKKEDINDDIQIQAYYKYNKYPSPKELQCKSRPEPQEFQEFKETPNYFKNGNQLRPYQLEGLNWLNFSYHQKRNTILGDEMGLGKTVQSVSILETLRHNQGIRGPFLCIAPLTTIPHWKREFDNWTDMNVLVYHDLGNARPILRNYEIYYRDKKGNIIEPRVTKFNVLITTYEMAISDRAYLNKIKWKYLVIDEAHRLKNQSCKLTNELKTYTYDHLLLLTGTPLQNNIQELWALLNFADSKNFNNLQEFLNEFGDLQDAEQVSKLQVLLKPYLLRRMKENVEKSIAPKEETIVEVELTTIQKKYYRAIYEKNFSFLKKGCKGQGPSLLNIMMELRKCCNHPYLIKGVEQSETQSLNGDKEVFKKLIQASGKLVLVDKLLPKLQQGKHKVLIFSQMVGVLNILDDYLTFRGYPHERIDGAVKASDRQAAIDRFSKPDSDRFVFLLCTRAGGIGINLTAADTVIIFDSDWNPQNDLQAQARCHRIGQDKMVKVYRLVTRNTYERLMFDRASKKLGLDRAVLTNNNNNFSGSTSNKEKENSSGVPNKETINSLLKYGAYAMKDDDTSAEQFYEEDIENILDRSTVIKEDTSKSDPLASSFSTASFCSSSSVPHIDVNDPNFWDKFKPELEGKDESLLKPRSRRNVSRFGQKSFDDELEGDLIEEKSSFTNTTNTRSQQGTLYKGWTPSERTRFKAILLMFGSGRWDLLRYLSDISNWTIEQCNQFGTAMITKIINEYEKEFPDSKLTVDFFNSIVPSLESDVLQYYITNELDQKAQFEKSKINNNQDKTLEKENSEEPEEFLLLPKDHIQYDESGNILLSQFNKDSSEDNLFLNDTSITDSYFNEYLKRNVKEVVRKLNNMSSLAHVLRIGYENLVNIVGELSDQPYPWWKLKEDQDLLVGTYKHGFGQYEEIRNDPNLCFSSYKWKSIDTNEITDEMKVEKDINEDPSSDLKTWPSSKLLSHRVKRLIKQLENYKKQQEKDTKSEKKQQEKSKIEEKKKKRQEEWTKKEKSDFYKFLMVYGVIEIISTDGKNTSEYSWDILKEKANLKKKSIELIERFYFELLTKYSQSQSDNNSNNSSITGEDISIVQCKKLVNRVYFFTKIRNTILKHSNPDSTLIGIQIPHGFPKWWISGIHDIALLRGIAKHGYLQLDDICNDPTLPFYGIANGISSPNGKDDNIDQEMTDPNQSKKRKFKENLIELLQFPKDKVVSKRIDYVVDYSMAMITGNNIILNNSNNSLNNGNSVNSINKQSGNNNNLNRSKQPVRQNQHQNQHQSQYQSQQNQHQNQHQPQHQSQQHQNFYDYSNNNNIDSFNRTLVNPNQQPIKKFTDFFPTYGSINRDFSAPPNKHSQSQSQSQSQPQPQPQPQSKNQISNLLNSTEPSNNNDNHSINVLPDKKFKIDDIINSTESSYDDYNQNSDNEDDNRRVSKKLKNNSVNINQYYSNHNNNNNQYNNNNTGISNLNNILNTSDSLPSSSFILPSHMNQTSTYINPLNNIQPKNINTKSQIRLSIYDEVGSDDENEKVNIQRTIERGTITYNHTNINFSKVNNILSPTNNQSNPSTNNDIKKMDISRIV